MSNTTIDEASRRRPDFDPDASAWVTLADGQAWAVPRPAVGLRAEFKGGRPVRQYRVPTYGPALDDLVKAIGELTDPELVLSGTATLAAALLRRNYDLADEVLDALLAFRPSDPVSLRWPEDIMRVAAMLA